jgi:AcrR family transcriptional regulator
MAKPDIESRLAEAAFKLLASKKWADLTLASVARLARIPLAQLLLVAPSRPALLGLMLNRLSQDTARRYRPDRASQSARDRVFDVSMTWFSVARPRRKALHNLHEGLRRDPATLLGARRDILGAAEWILVLAEADVGRAMPVRVAIVSGIFACILPIWLTDDDKMGKTMAALDRSLRNAERFLWPRQSPKKKAHTAPHKKRKF